MDPLGRQKRAAEGCTLMKTTLTVIGPPSSVKAKKKIEN